MRCFVKADNWHKYGVCADLLKKGLREEANAARLAPSGEHDGVLPEPHRARLEAIAVLPDRLVGSLYFPLLAVPKAAKCKHVLIADI